MTSYIALALSVAAFAFTLFNWNQARERDRRDLFLKMHERLLDSELQRGRKLALDRIKSPEDAARMRDTNPDDYDLVNRALAIADFFAFYVDEGYIDRSIALKKWKYAFTRLRAPAEHFMQHRKNMNDDIAWPNLRRFCEESERIVHEEAAVKPS